MKYTNKYNLPNPFLQFFRNDSHRSADYSASMLHNPVRIVWLNKRHKKELTKDIMDRIWVLLGQSVHSILENASDTNLVEFYIEHNVFPEISLSGKPDIYDCEKQQIDDYKVTSVWNIINMSSLDAWKSQLNVYAWLLRQEGYTVKSLMVDAILRDWNKRKAQREDNYPKTPIVRIPIPLGDEVTQLNYIKKRITLFEKYKSTPDNDLPFCSDKDRWKDPVKYAVMKKGKKKAIKLYTDKREAEARAKTENGYVEIRESTPDRCLDYCSVSHLCNQHQEWMKNEKAL